MLGPIPKDDDTFLQVVDLATKTIKEMKQLAKAGNFVEAKLQKYTTENEKVIKINQHHRTENKRKKLIKIIKKKKKIKNLKRKNIPPRKRP
jgi:hypothetical protein